MKIKFNRVFKCVSCLVTCFMVVLTAMVSPAYGAVAVYDPADYISEISVSGDVKTITYDFNDIPGYFRWWTGTELIEFYGWGFSGQVEAHTNWPAVSWFPFGAYASSSGFGAALDISDILPYSDIDFSASMEVIVHLEDFHDTDYVNGSYKVEYFYYDANMQYIGNYVTPVMTHKFELVSTDDKYGAAWLGTIEYSGTFPADAVYVVPYFNISFGIPTIYLPDSIMDITFQRAGFLLSVDMDTVLDNSHQMQVIQDKLDSIITGSPGQNEDASNSAGIVEDQKEHIGELVDQMTPSRPNTDHIDTDINAIAGDEATALFSDGMSGILNHPLILSMLSIVAVVSFIGYVLFGKVG